MPVIINPTITDAGLAAAATANTNGVQVNITHIALGDAGYAPVGSETSLSSLREAVAIGSGSVTDNGASVSVSVRFPPFEGASYLAREIGFYLGDPDAGGVLFAVYSTTGPDGIVARGSLDFVAQFNLGLTRVPAGSVNVQIDPDMAALFLMIQDHKEEANPHVGYLLSAQMVGAVSAFATPAAPAGWLVANGAAVSRATYSALFAAIGTTYGVGDGATTFNLPDLRGEFVRGVDAGRGVDVGRVLGSGQSDRMKNHYHGVGDFQNENQDDFWIILRDWAGQFTSRWIPGSANRRELGTVNGGSGGTRWAGTSDQVEVAGSETRPRNVALLYCIKH